MKKIIISLVLLLILSSCETENKQEHSLELNKNNQVQEEILNQKSKIQEKKSVDLEKKNILEKNELEKRKNKIAEINNKIKEKNQKKEILENKNSDIIKFCKNLNDKGDLACQLHKIGDKKWNYHSGIIVKKVGKGEKINLGDYIKYKIIETNDKKWEGKEFIFYIGESLDDFSGNTVHEKLLSGFPLKTEIVYYNSLIRLEKKVVKQDLLNQYESLLDEKIKENPGKKDDIKKEFQKYIDEIKSKLDEKLIYEKPAIQIVGDGQETGIIINNIKYGNGKDFGANDKVYIKNLDKTNEIGKLYRKIFIENGKLTSGSKITSKQYYNGGNGGNIVETEIVDKK